MTVVYIVLRNVYLVERGSRERRRLHPTKILWHHSTCHVCKKFSHQFKHSAGITILDQKILFWKTF